MPKKDEKIAMLTLLKMAIKDKEIPKVGNFSINNDLLKRADIFSYRPCNTKVNVCHNNERFVVNFMAKKRGLSQSLTQLP